MDWSSPVKPIFIEQDDKKGKPKEETWGRACGSCVLYIIAVPVVLIILWFLVRLFFGAL